MNRAFFELLVLACSALGLVFVVGGAVIDAALDLAHGYVMRRRARQLLARYRALQWRGPSTP